MAKLTSFNHFHQCFNYNPIYDGLPTKIKAQCSSSGSDGKRCDSSVSNQGCIEKDCGIYYGYCHQHWKEYCDYRQWDWGLSKCANMLADLQRISVEDRKKINKINIEDILGITSDHNHISGFRIRTNFAWNKKSDKSIKETVRPKIIHPLNTFWASSEHRDRLANIPPEFKPNMINLARENPEIIDLEFVHLSHQSHPQYLKRKNDSDYDSDDEYDEEYRPMRKKFKME